MFSDLMDAAAMEPGIDFRVVVCQQTNHSTEVGGVMIDYHGNIQQQSFQVSTIHAQCQEKQHYLLQVDCLHDLQSEAFSSVTGNYISGILGETKSYDHHSISLKFRGCSLEKCHHFCNQNLWHLLSVSFCLGFFFFKYILLLILFKKYLQFFILLVLLIPHYVYRNIH